MKTYDGSKLNDQVCNCDESTITLTEAEVDQMIEAVVSGGTWDNTDTMTDDEIRAEVRAAIKSCEI